MIDQFVKNDPLYMQNLTSGIWESAYPDLTFIFLKGFQQGDAVVPADYAAFDFLQNISGVTAELEAAQFPSWYSAYTELINPALSAGDLVGVSILDISRIISSDLLGSESGRQNISDFITALPSGQSFLFERVSGGAVSQVDSEATAINPAWRTALAYGNIPVFDSLSDGPISASTNSTTDTLTKEANIVFGSDAYYNEDNKREPDYTKVFWGSNYARLLSLKEEFDPNCVLTSSATVGQLELCGGT
ncbi:hypothetical protein BD289DRAFT_442225 [Coniella lustricola]|uniref:Berberine/berberine-like domain-containing protein n=1 Tax=Coniella lustricola TaxID=2025994 RepID=A0A2T2ZYI1_9PEZI|nr:hypothetical protein BD289DRAFT_442225 [Coniella lustricola]